MMNIPRVLLVSALLAVILFSSVAAADRSVEQTLKEIDVDRGIVAVLDLPGEDAGYVVELANAGELTVYFQSADARQVAAVREAAAAAGLLGVRVFADRGPASSIHLADNIADSILVAPSLKGKVSDQELLRALRPLATALVGDRKLLKPVPDGIDQWTHPYHGPDNNPQSTDQLARGQFRTQFLAEPKFSPMPEQSVIAGGRVFKAMGHIAHKANQNAMLNTLLCINAYNGTILWRRALPPGFMIHRNTMIATNDALYMGDHQSCKILDARTGKIRGQITVPPDITDGPVWKWMAMQDGVLYALVGNPEIQVDVQKSKRRGLGHWPWSMWKGHDYKDPKTSFGFGRTLVAIDVKTKKLLWHHREQEFLDARGMCMNGQQIFYYSPGKFLASINARSGSPLWKSSDQDMLAAIGPSERAQHYVTGYSTTSYMKCNGQYIFFAGPQRKKLAVVSAQDGKLAWTHPDGNLQLVLRGDGIYAAGPKTTGVRLDYATGKKLASLPTRRACTRATGCVDSIFYRTSGGTVRVMTDTNTAQHIAPMRPPCQDGVLISNGNLYWGPWMCGCQLSLYGHICLSPAPPSTDNKNWDIQHAAHTAGKDITNVQPLNIQPGDWASYRGNNARTDATEVDIPAKVKPLWEVDICSTALPTAPVVAGGLIFIADRTGAVRALDENGKLVWKTYTAGPVYYPPAVAHSRVYVGSADGRVHALEAHTGRFLWSYRVAPRDRWIPVYGKLISTWPVAGGVVVEGDTVYAAAGIAHYDGTYVVALDAVTGRLKAHNSTSGVLSPEVNGGISMQGNLMIAEGQLRFLGGGVYETARYDLKTLKSLNTPKVQLTSQFYTAFYPYYPSYGKFVSLDHTCADGSTLCHDASYEGSRFSNLALQSPLPPGTPKQPKYASRWSRRNKTSPKNIWQDKTDRRFTSFVVSKNLLLATGHPDKTPDKPFLAAMNIHDGADVWIHPLPADAVKGGAAIDRQGRIYIALENGQLVCFTPEKT